MNRQDLPRIPTWRRRLHARAFIRKLENAEPHRLRFNDEHIEQIDLAISVAIHRKNPEEAAADERLHKIRKAANELGSLLHDHIEKDRPSGVPSKRCVPGCDDAPSLLNDLQSIAPTGSTMRKARRRGHTSDLVTDFMLVRLWEIYGGAGGEGTPGSFAFAYFLEELTSAMPKCLLGTLGKGSAGKRLARRAKDLGQRPVYFRKDKITRQTVE